MGGVTISVEKPPLAFIFSVTTTNTPHTFSLPIYDGGVYDFSVDWGDGSSDDIIVYSDPARSHSYATPGIHEITISGTLKGWNFREVPSSRLLLIDIKQWGIFNHDNAVGAFYRCDNLTDISATDKIDLTGITSFDQFFYQCDNLATVAGINDWDVSGIEIMEYMFSTTLFNSNISAWNVGNVTNMFEMFGATPFDQNISGWDVGNVETFQSMFWSNVVFNQDISGWDVSNATTFVNMFAGANSFNQDIGGWITSSLVTAASMFANNSGFDQNIGGWDVTNITDAPNSLNWMFNGVTLSTANYNALLIGWEGQTVQDNIIFNGGNSKYSGAAVAAKQRLIDDHNWTITDGGEV